MRDLVNLARPNLAELNRTDDQSLNPRDLYKFLGRYAGIIILFIFVFDIIGIIYLTMASPNYIAYSQVLVEARRVGWTGLSGEGNYAQFSLDSSQLEGQIQILKSEQIARPVVNALKLSGDPELVRRPPGLYAKFMASVFGTPIKPDDTPTDTSAITSLIDRLQVRRIGQSHVLEISYWSTNAEKAARICNSITAAFISDRIKAKIEAAESGSEILERKISVLRDQQNTADQVVLSGILKSESFPVADARVITTANAPLVKSWPRPSLVISFSTLVGLFLGVLSALVHRSLDNSVTSREQVERELGLKCLGLLPDQSFSFWFFRWNGYINRRLNSAMLHNPLSSFSKALQQIKTSIQLQYPQPGALCLGIVSTTGKEGKTTIAINLALAFSAANHRTVMIDADFLHRRLTTRFGRRAQLGLTDMINGRATIEEVIIKGELGKPDFIPNIEFEGFVDSAELLRSSKMEMLMVALQQRYDLVIMDLPAFEEAPDARAITSILTGVIFVIEHRRLPVDRIRQARVDLGHMEGKLLGAILNKARSY